MSVEKSRRLKRIKSDVIERDGNVCCYCELELKPEEITMEHIVPNSKKGTFNSTNLTVSCGPCNRARGNKPFFEYCKNFNWSPQKIKKFRSLYYNNLKIKILNIAKETCLVGNYDVPQELIEKACKILKIKEVDFTPYEGSFPIQLGLNELVESKKIKYCFQHLIKMIELEV